MSRLKHVLKPWTLVTIHNSLVLPHLYFSILCWGFESERLVKLQKRAVRIIHRAKYNAHSEPLLKKSGLIAQKDIFDFQRCKFYYKFKHNLLPDFTNFFTLNNQIHNYNTRSSADLHRFPVNKSRTDLCIRHYNSSLFNCLPTEVKNRFDIHSTAVFSHGYKLSLLNKYSSECRLRINNNKYVYRQSQVRKSTDSGAKWAECSLIIGTGCRVQVFSLILDSSVGLSASIQYAGELVSGVPGSNPAFSRGTQLVSFRFEYRLPVPEHRN